jgi:phosphate/sulfate permease
LSSSIVKTWLITFPVCLVLGFVFTWLFTLIF